MPLLRNNFRPHPVAILFLGIILTLAIALALPTGLGANMQPQPATAENVTQQVIPPAPATSQGVSVHGVPAWNSDGYTGSTIKIGILDRDFTGFTGLMGTELPQDTPIITRVHPRCYTGMGFPTNSIANCEDPCTVNCKDYVGHGTSVAEIISDVAPSASLYIANPGKFKRARDLKDTVKWMADQGVKVINHSVSYGINAPGNGSSGLPASDNHILDVINYAVTRGIIWVTSGGNDAEKTWYGPYRDGTNVNNWHEFSTVSGGDEANTIYLNARAKVVAELRWDDSWGGADCDLDLYLKNTTTNSTVASGILFQRRQPDDTPYESLSYTVKPTESGYYYLGIHKWSCSDTPDWMQLRFTGTPDLEHHSGGHDVGVPAESNNAGMLAVGAARHDNTNDVRDSSNRGPTVLPYPAGRTKPDIVGATCVVTKTDPPEFCGTSAAAPHIAGLAALVRNRYSTHTPAQVANYLKTNALVRGGSVPNHDWGNGFAYLPPRGTISPPPSTVAERTFTALTALTNVPSPGIGISLNEVGDTGNLSFTSTCPGSTKLASRRVDGDAVIIYGCTAGTATVKVYEPATGNSLQTYTMTVTTTTTTGPTSSGLAIAKTLYVGDTETIDIARKFGGSVSGYTVASSDPRKATASMSGSDLRITALAPGPTSVTVTASNPSIFTATQRYDLTIETPVPPATLAPPQTRAINIGDTTSFNVSSYFSGNVDSYTVSPTITPAATALFDSPILKIIGVAAGNATFTVTAKNNTNAIGTAIQNFGVTVTSLVPMASGTPTPQSVTAGNSTTFGTASYFTGKVDSYSAVSLNAAVVTASMNGSNLTITGVAANSTPVTVRVTATNNTNAIGTATQDYPVTVTATTTTPTAGGPTVPTGGPSVNAYSDQAVTTGASVSLTGSGSPVDDDDDASYNWTQQSGTTVNLKAAVTGLPYTSGLSGNAAGFTAPSTAGTLIFRLTVTDHGTGISSWDELVITVS